MQHRSNMISTKNKKLINFIKLYIYAASLKNDFYKYQIERY